MEPSNAEAESGGRPRVHEADLPAAPPTREAVGSQLRSHAGDKPNGASGSGSQADGRSPSLPLVEVMSQPAAYARLPGESTEHVECVETHISWVFLTDRFAYKLKKPVRFDFLDFSTPELRLEACLNEVRLNRRLAPAVYLGVEPITCSRHGRLTLGGGGMAVDWVVKMRRLPEERALDRLLVERRATPAEIDALAARLSAFYERLPPLPIQADVYRRGIEAHVEGNHRELLKAGDRMDVDLVHRVHAAQLRLLRLVPGLLDERVCDGRIVEGHGDLRPEHVYLMPHPTIIDCIEFNSELRQIDVLDELGFLAMECDRLGAAEAGERILRPYLMASRDRAPAALLAFYKMYRACVRAKVALLRARQVSRGNGSGAAGPAEEYLALADGYAPALGPPFALVVFGLSGTGKSTLAAAMGEALDVEVLSSDAVRDELCQPQDRTAGYGEGRYTPDRRRRVYEEMFRRAGAVLGRGNSVILDATFLAADMRREAVSLAARHGAEPLLVRCQCPDEVVLERIGARAASGTSLSEAGPEVYRHQKREVETELSDLPAFAVDSTQSLPMLVRAVMGCIASLIPSRPVFESESP